MPRAQHYVDYVEKVQEYELLAEQEPLARRIYAEVALQWRHLAEQVRELGG